VSGRLGRTLLGMLGIAAIAAGTNVAMDKLAKDNPPREPGGKTPADERAELLEDLRVMKAEDKGNLLRRYTEARIAFQERRFVRLLCNIRQDPQEGRRPTLKYLNDLSDPEFEQMVNLLDDGNGTLSSKIDDAAGRVAEMFKAAREQYQRRKG